jgi:hypothetical protein
MAEVRREIAKKTSEIYNELLVNLDEFRAIHKYHPDLLRAFMDDEYIGKVLLKKAWLLDFHSVPPKDAAGKLQQIRSWRAQLKDAERFLRTWVGPVDSRAIIATYPILKGHIVGELDKADAQKAIEELDKALLKEGWLVLLSDSLIQIPIAKFMSKVNQFLYEELQAKAALIKASGRGTIAETAALRAYQAVSRKRQRYEGMVVQLLLANPAYLSSLKKKKTWLSRERQGNLDKIVKSVTPHKIKERAWLDQMREKIESG